MSGSCQVRLPWTCLGLVVSAALLQTACSTRACDKNTAISCVALGQSLSHSSLPENISKASQIFQETCDDGDVKGCDGLLQMVIEGKGADTSRAAFQLFERTCQRGVAGGCADLGVMYGRGEAVGQDRAKAVEYFEKACDAGGAVGCTYLGEWYSNAGVQVGWNCGRPAFCTILGDAAASVPKDDAKSFQFFKRACDGGDATGCVSVSIMYQKGAGVRQDAAQAAAFWKKSLALNKAQ